MNAVVKASSTALGIPEEDMIRVLGNSLYPGAKPDSIRLALAWCKATGRDPMKRPIHIVPMWVKDAVTGQSGMRDVLMPGIGTYRTDAAESGDYAGKSEPEFGPDVTGRVGGVQMTYPKWCKVVIKRMVRGVICDFPAKEFWLENYATAGRDKEEPNTMWRKRPYGMLAKCAESQALRMAFPDETGNTNTAEEMEGKTFDGMTIDVETSRSTGAAIGDEIPNRVMEQKPKGRTARQYLDSLQATLTACHTEWEINAVSQSDDVTKAVENFTKAKEEGRPAALTELNAMLAEALERVRASEAAADEPVPEDDFPGDRP